MIMTEIYIFKLIKVAEQLPQYASTVVFTMPQPPI